MPILNNRKLRKLARDPKLFFLDAIQNKKLAYQNTLKKFKLKKYKASESYVIVSAVYNVEKYLDKYFKSIIDQRLDFKNNIHIILVDDGSTDASADIIKKYQKAYPKNITYIYKENGGQASARNLGLKYIDENLKDKFSYVTFTDPDDFLDREYFYEVDECLKDNKNLSMIGCNIVFYYELVNAFKDNHPLSFKFKNGLTIKRNSELNNFVQLSAASAFFNINYLNNTPQKPSFKEGIPNFEDAWFVNEFLMQNLSLKSAFLKNAQYYYTKRAEANSTLDNVDNANKKQLIKSGYLLLLLLLSEKINKTIPKFIQETILYDLIWFLKANINQRNFDFLSKNEKDDLFSTLEQIYSKIDLDEILKFNLAGCWFFHKVAIIGCFRHEYPPFQISYIDDFDGAKEQIKLYYFTPDKNDIESIRIDGVEVYPDIEKIRQYDFLDMVFVYEKIFWIHIPKNAKKLELFIDGKKARVTFDKAQYQTLDLNLIHNKFASIKKQKAMKEDLWMFIDKDLEADDNAEHLYRYVSKNHPSQNIAYILRKESKDYERLKNDGFNLVDFKSAEFKTLAKKSSKLISSHADEYFLRYFKEADFVFLQHGVTKDDVSNWLNKKPIRLFITASKAEYDSIASNFNHYKFSHKDTALTGFARHDALLQDNKTKKQILIMPTWRRWLADVLSQTSSRRETKDGFDNSEFFIKWNELLNSDELKKICQDYNYEVLFNPHPNMIQYLKYFNLSSHIKLANPNDSLQELFKSSALMITDYSSVAFDMAYINKPVIYYQFDEEEFFGNHSYIKGYFDYRTNGFGPVADTKGELLKELDILLKNNCIVKEPQLSNIQNTFAFKDEQNAKRNYEAILALDEPWQNDISLEHICQKANDAFKRECFNEAMQRFKYVLSRSENFNEDFANWYLNSAIKIDQGYEVAKDLLQNYEINSKELNLLILKTIINSKKFTKDDIRSVMHIIENLEVKDEQMREFLFFKLRLYFCLADFKKANVLKKKLLDEFDVDPKDMHYELDLLIKMLAAFGDMTLIKNEINSLNENDWGGHFNDA